VLAALGPAARADQTLTATEMIIRLNVHPAAAPKPALRYLLLPDLKELNPGNPIQGYLRCFAEQQNFFFNKEACDRREQLLTMPLRDLPAQELQDYGRLALRQADWAARLDKPDWQILLKVKSEGINLLIPDVQQLRLLANTLKVRFRAEVALHRFDDGLRTARTMFAMSRHLSEHPTLIGGLVGTAIATITLGPLEEMLEQPGCPNLYWALTNLPNPLVPMEKGLEGERVLVQSELQELDDSAPMSAEQIQKLIVHIDKIRALDDKPPKPGDDTRAWLNARLKDGGAVAAARRRLVEVGLPEERLLRFPADQVLLLDERREYEVRRDEIMKQMNLPSWQFDWLAGQRKSDKEPALFDIFTPALVKVRQAQARLEQRMALLRHVEALRLYAAAHDGRWPATLAEVSVPLPADPFNGKPFLYHADGAVAHVRGSPPPGGEKQPVLNVHYELTLQK
jgi:hypothetical protein